MILDFEEATRRLIDVEIEASLVAFRTPEMLESHLGSIAGVKSSRIGESRDGRAMHGAVFGSGAKKVSVIAGSHADEPIGPMTAQALPVLLPRYFPELLDSYTFHIVPQMNPDGAETNRPWFSDSIDMACFLENVRRELPGEDIEFGFGEDDGTRPECRAAQNFLQDKAPFSAHFSLHGMAWAEGLWCLLSPEWVERATPYMEALAGLCEQMEIPLHDVERHGEKGFNRIRRGFCTTPNHLAMKEFFLAQDDAAMAALFRPSSMEWIRSLGGDPLCIVSELPLFLMGKQSPGLDHSVKTDLKERIAEWRAGGDADALNEIIADFQLRQMDIPLQMRLQFAMVVFACAMAAKQ